MHLAAPQDNKDVCKKRLGPWRILGFHEQLFLCIFHEIHFLTPQLQYVSVAASISMATPLHHNLKLYEATPRTGRTPFWVTTPLRHTLICVLREEWGVGNYRLTSRQPMFNYLTSHSASTSILKGQSHETSLLWFFSSISSFWSY